jgi:hypothetical protein
VFSSKDKCGSADPLIVEWPSASRGKLETQSRRGLVVVRYAGCDIEVLGQCRAPGGYRYAPMTRKHDRVTIKDEDELYARIPVYAAQFEGKLRSAGRLSVEMTLVGRYEAEEAGVRDGDLQGECAGATHVITALSAGAFRFLAGAGAEGGAGIDVAGAGAGARTASERETLTEDGSEQACEKAARGDSEPPDGCGALVRIEVAPLGRGKTEAACPAGTSREGEKCISIGMTATTGECPPGSKRENGACVDPGAAGISPVAGPTTTVGTIQEAGGYAADAIHKAIEPAMGRVRECYAQALAAKPELSGSVKVGITIGASGEVLEVSSAGSSLNDAKMQTCVLKNINGLTFPEPAGGKRVKIVYPLVFSPR